MTAKNAYATSTPSDDVATAESTFDRRGFMALGACIAIPSSAQGPGAGRAHQFSPGNLVVSRSVYDNNRSIAVRYILDAGDLVRLQP